MQTMTREQFLDFVHENDAELEYVRHNGREMLEMVRAHNDTYAETLEAALDALDKLHEVSQFGNTRRAGR